MLLTAEARLKLLIKAMWLASMCLALCACAHAHYMMYDDISTIEGIATQKTEVSTPLGLNTINERVFIVPHNGSNPDGTWKDPQKSTKISESAAQSPGIVGGMLQNGASASGAAQAAVAGAVVDVVK